MSADVFIYGSAELPVARDELEDAIEELLGSRGEVTGGGAGSRGWNIDVEVFNPDEVKEIRSQLIELLRELSVGQDTYLVVDGERRNVF